MSLTRDNKTNPLLAPYSEEMLQAIRAALGIPVPGYGYLGRDLSKYMTMDELADKVEAGDFRGIGIGDYWPGSLTGTYHDYADDVDKTLTNAVVIHEIAAINPYINYGDTALTKNHLLMVSRDCLPNTAKWRSAADAWYDETQTNPFRGSHLYQTLNASDGIISLVEQTDIGKHIYTGPNGAGMRFMGEVKAKGATEATTWEWIDRGKLFLPTEREIWDQDVWSEHTWGGGGNCLQWPIFAGSRRHIMKGLGNGGSRYGYWSSSSMAGSAVGACFAFGNGTANNAGAAYALGVPLCYIFAKEE